MSPVSRFASLSWSAQVGGRTIHAESRGEPELGERAVAAVIVNRATDPKKRFGNSVAGVCLRPAQFSCWNTSDPNRKVEAELNETDPTLLKFIDFLNDAIVGVYPDPTRGCKWYKVTTLPWPKDWGPERHPIVIIGNHAFYDLDAPLEPVV